MKKFLDLKLFVLVAILTVALVFIGVNFMEGQVKTQGKPNKPDKPDKPGKPDTEWIEFWGDLNGGQEVKGCCPNAGPWPEYTMMLTFDVPSNCPPIPGFSPGIYYDGQLFINYFGAGRNQEYKVQFWKEEWCTGIEIIGGVIKTERKVINGRKTSVLTVTFENDECVDLWTDTHIAWVTFTLVRYTIRE